MIQILGDIQRASMGRVQKATVFCHLKVLVLLIDAKFPIDIMVGSSRPVAHVKVNAAVNGVASPFPFSRYPTGMPGMLKYLALIVVHLGIDPGGKAPSPAPMTITDGLVMISSFFVLVLSMHACIVKNPHP